jgi:predicted transcriptional regulator
MAEKRNLTIQLDADTIRKARILAVERSVSVSRLVADEIERMVKDEEQYHAAHRQALDLMSRGLHLGGEIPPSREELYDRGR